MSEYLVSKEDKRAKRNEPWEVDYHGMVLHIRLEHNLETKEIKKIVVTVREELEEQGRHCVTYGKVMLVRKYTPVCEHPLYDNDADVEAIVQATLDRKMADSFLPDLYRAYPTMMVPELPCAILLPYALGRLNALGNVTKGTLGGRAKALGDILAYWGDEPLLELTPERCAPVLLELPKKRAEQCITLLRQVYAGTFARIVADPHQWERYHMLGRRRQYDPTRRVRRELMPAVYTVGQCKEFAARCETGIESGRAKQLWYAVAGVMLVTGLGAEEVCALKVYNFAKMEQYDGMYVDIKYTLADAGAEAEEGRKRRKRLKAVALEGPRNRRLAVGTWARSLLAPLAAMRADALVLHDARNANRYLAPQDYADWLEKTFGDIAAGRDIRNAKLIRDTHTVEDYLCGTAPFCLAQNGYLAEEVRYQKGLAPQHTDAQYYVDMQAESELVTMAAMQDQWIANVDEERKRVNKSSKKYVQKGQPRRMLRTRITIHLPVGTELPTDMYMRLGAAGGLTAVVTDDSIGQAK